MGKKPGITVLFFFFFCFSVPDKAIPPFTRISVLTLWFSHHRSSLLLLLRFDFRGFQNTLRVKTLIVSFTLLYTQQHHLSVQVFVSSPGVKVGVFHLLDVSRYTLEPSKKNTDGLMCDKCRSISLPFSGTVSWPLTA